MAAPHNRALRAGRRAGCFRAPSRGHDGRPPGDGHHRIRAAAMVVGGRARTAPRSGMVADAQAGADSLGAHDQGREPIRSRCDSVSPGVPDRHFSRWHSN